MRVAIVGTGISGLVAARELARRHRVDVFEAADRLGGHTHTVEVTRDEGTWAIDTGFIVFNEPNYPLFCNLLRELGAASRATDMSFSVRSDRTGVEYNGTSLNGLFAQRRNLVRPSFLVMIRDILRFNRMAPQALEEHADPDETVEEWVTRHRFSRSFVDDHLLPLGAALWSCPTGTFSGFPIRFLVAFLANHGMLTVEGRPTWRTIVGGSSTYLEPLAASFREQVHLSTAVRRIRRGALGVSLLTDGGEWAAFDHVVLACHSDQALALLEEASPQEREILGAIRYQSNDVVLHTDVSLLPRNRRAWASWNYRIVDGPSRAATVTYDMSILQGLDAPVEFCVTLNQSEDIDLRHVIRRLRYEHPIFDVEAERARQRRTELLRANGTSFCGAYWGYGFHEDGVRSAMEVSRALEGSAVE